MQKVICFGPVNLLAVKGDLNCLTLAGIDDDYRPFKIVLWKDEAISLLNFLSQWAKGGQSEETSE